MSKDWLPWSLDGNPRSRLNRNPRGIENPENACYMNSVLQTLMHTPIFLNWIRTHNAGADCGRNCLKCNMRGFVTDYWGPDCATRPISENNQHLVGIKDAAWANTYFEADNQEDANEVYNGFLFDDTHGLAAGDDEWKKQFNAMFNFERVPFDTCHECGIERRRIEPPTTGLDVPIRPQWPPLSLFSTLVEAIQGVFSIETLEEYNCPTSRCRRLRRTKYAGKHGPPQFRRWVLRTAPSVLKIRVFIYAHTLGREEDNDKNESDDDDDDDDDDNFMPVPKKILDTLAIDETLDLTQFQEGGSESTPLTYQLSTLVSHCGEHLDSGHNIASVRSPGSRPFYNISDAEWVEPISRQQFLANPQSNSRTMGEKFQVYTLTYIMDEQPKPVVSAMTTRMLRELA
jgi:uncharacterized UBP type Zn finger protein